jgi:protein pelota
MRKMYVNLVDKVKECGGDVYVFSRSHVSGEKLNELSGIAAVLRFPFNMDYLDEKEDEVEKQREEEEKKEKLDEEDDKLSDVGSIVNDEELDRDFNEALEESKEKQDKSHSHKDVDKKEHKKDEERKINESSAKDEDGEDI